MNHDLEGYELAYGEEGYGKHFFGLKIFVKMSNRKIVGFTESGVPYDNISSGAREIRKAIETTTAQLDPEGPANRKRHKEEIVSIYNAAGVNAIYMEELPNGYCGEPCCLNKPWFRVTSSIGHVVIGWRKSVISIDWKDSSIKKTAMTLFPTENVTRWDTGVHAWGAEKASQYIAILHALRKD